MEKTPTVAELRQNNYKVRVLHFRRKRTGNNNPGKLVLIKDLPGPQRHHLGGKTRVEITTPEGKNLTGEATCIKEDCFDRRKGLGIAMNNALNPKPVVVEKSVVKQILEFLGFKK